MKPLQLQPFALSVLQLLALALLGYGIYLIQGVIIFAIIALYLSILGRPLVRLLQRYKPLRKVNSLVAAVVLIILVSVIGGILSILVPLLIAEFAFLADINYGELLATLENEWEYFDGILSTFGIDTKAEINKLSSTIEGYASADAIAALAGSILGSVGNLAIATFSILFMTFFLLKEQHLAHQFIDKITPTKHHSKVDELTPKVKRIVTRYSFGILMQISAIFVLLAIGLSIIGVQGAVVLALFAAVFNLIPYVGPIIGAALGILLSMGQLYAMQQADPTVSVDLVNSLYGLMTLFAAVQLMDNIVFQPLIFSNSVGAHPLEIFLVISIAGTLLGVGGMIFAVPLYSIVRIVAGSIWIEWSKS